MNIIIDILLWITYIISLYFSIFLFLVYVEQNPKVDPRANSQRNTSLKNTLNNTFNISHHPFISILVPAYNEQSTIVKTLESIYNINYPKDKIEVLVINDGSTDQTKEKITQYIQDKPYFHLISHSNRGKAASLNIALTHATGEFFACLDADSFVEPLTLKKMLTIYEQENDPQLAIITPAMKVHEPKNILQKVQWLEYLVIILIGRITSQLDSLYVAPGPFSLYNTKIIKQLGGFDEKNITEDQEIAYRIQSHQYRIKQCPNGYVYTTAPSKLKQFYRQRRRWYLGSILCVHQYRNLIANRKYGDFGMMQMVKNAAGYLLAITGIAIAITFIIQPWVENIKELFLINFNIAPYLATFKIKITFLTFLLTDFRKGFIILSLTILGIYFFYVAHKNANEKINKFGWVPLIPYFAFYYTLKATILILTLFQFTQRKKFKW